MLCSFLILDEILIIRIVLHIELFCISVVLSKRIQCIEFAYFPIHSFPISSESCLNYMFPWLIWWSMFKLVAQKI